MSLFVLGMTSSHPNHMSNHMRSLFFEIWEMYMCWWNTCIILFLTENSCIQAKNGSSEGFSIFLCLRGMKGVWISDLENAITKRNSKEGLWGFSFSLNWKYPKMMVWLRPQSKKQLKENSHINKYIVWNSWSFQSIVKNQRKWLDITSILILESMQGVKLILAFTCKVYINK